MKPSILRALLIATLLAAQLGTVALFTVDANRRVADELDANARAGLATLAETVGARSARTLGAVENDLRTMRRTIELDLVDVGNDRALERLFTAALDGDERVRSFYVGRADGSFVSVARLPGGTFRTKRVRQLASGAAPMWQTFHEDEHGRRRQLFDPASGYDPRVRPWYRAALNATDVAWTDPYTFYSNGEPGISAGIALGGGGDGETDVLGVDLELGTFSEFIGKSAGVDQGSAVLIDHAGFVIAASDLPSSVDRAGRARPSHLESWADASLIALAEAADARANGGTDHPTGSSAAGFERLTLADGDRLGLALPFRPGGTPGDWSLLVQVPIDSYAGATTDYFLARSRWLLGALLTLSLAAMAAILGATAPVVRIHRDATVDRLTGALARAEFERRLERLMADRRLSDRDGRTVVAALDLDGFKAINDTYGHAAGDEVLAGFVRRLQERLRPGDLLGRSGGDEFLMALRLPASADVHGVLERLRRHAVGEPIAGRDGTYDVGVTVGVARRGPNDTLARLLTRADRALIDGKTFEKNRVYVASDARPSAMKSLDASLALAANADDHGVRVSPATRDARSGIERLSTRPVARPVRG